jgi:hypothetical protein
LQRFNNLLARQQGLCLFADFLDFANLAVKFGDFLSQEGISGILIRLLGSDHGMPQDDGHNTRSHGNTKQNSELAAT